MTGHSPSATHDTPTSTCHVIIARAPETPQTCSLNFPTLGDTPPWSFGPGRLPPMLPVVTVR
jgi:hypothetical protein